MRFTDTRGYFVSEGSVYRLLKAHDLITSPAFIVMKAANEFRDKTTPPNQMWQTDFTYFKSEPLKAPLVQANGERLGVDVSVDHPRRLQPVHHQLEAVQYDEDV